MSLFGGSPNEKKTKIHPLREEKRTAPESEDVEGKKRSIVSFREWPNKKSRAKYFSLLWVLVHHFEMIENSLNPLLLLGSSTRGTNCATHIPHHVCHESFRGRRVKRF